MSSILDRFLDARREFIATSPTEYLALQIARKLSEFGHVREYVGLPPWMRQTVKTLFAVRCKNLDRQDHFIAF